MSNQMEVSVFIENIQKAFGEKVQSVSYTHLKEVLPAYNLTTSHLHALLYLGHH